MKKFTISATEEKNQYLKFSLENSWFENKWDHKKITGIDVEMLYFEDDYIMIDKDEYEVKNVKSEIFDEGYSGKMLKIYCDIDINLKNNYEDAPKKFKSLMEKNKIQKYFDATHPKVCLSFGDLTYNGKQKPKFPDIVPLSNDKQSGDEAYYQKPKWKFW